ncbi:MAG: type I-C CRISPR-associated protein Cas8c/Csd1 [Halanaerobiales bacterium]|nr:type I-C CRISPR-associated protein Cas8c/Csd1 [Halanaerobiales bacterium]
MIIQALYDYYNILLNDPEIEISEPGYSMAKVNFLVSLSKNGELLDITPLGEGKINWIELIVPEQKKRASGLFPYFMSDNSKYIFGCNFDSKKTEMTKGNFIKSKELHEKILQGVDNDKCRAILNFFQNWNSDECLSNEVIKSKLDFLQKSKSGNMAFKLDCETGYLHQDTEILKAWKKHCTMLENDVKGQCLVTGKQESIVRIHPGIKGIRNTNAAGATLVGVNAKAFESYQKTQGYISPVGESVAFGYTTALNYMLSNTKHRLQIGDATTVFWAEDTGGMCENLLLELFAPKKQEEVEVTHDSAITAYVKDSLSCLKNGKPIQQKADVNFYILGLSPNNARISIRFWYRDSFGQLIQKVWQHHEDMQIINMRQEIIPIPRIIYETIPRNAQKKEAAPMLSGALMKSVFTGTAYPQGLFYAIVNRIRADGEINDIRVGIIKAILKRNARLQNDVEKEGMITVSLNLQNTNIAYRLGRLFAVLEKAQTDAADVKLNTTIKDRYFGTASASPRAVFPVLMKLTQHHISKGKYGYISDKNIQEILQGVNEFPTHLNSEEQGLFILGYYHQRPALYKKSETQNEGETENE